MKISNLTILIVSLIVSSCLSPKSEQAEIFQSRRQNIVKLDQKNIHDIKMDLFFGMSELYIMDSLLVVREAKSSYEHALHLYNKNTFKYITSAGILGKGPGEVTRPGKLAVSPSKKEIWLSDHGKKVMWCFPLDSILGNKSYLPTASIPLNDDLFMVRPFFLNDSVIIGRAAKILDHNSFEMLTAKVNIRTNSIEPFGYQHPVAKGKRVSSSMFDVSLEDSIYVVAYNNVDLLSICTLDGNLVKNIYGPEWEHSLKDTEGRLSFFSGGIQIYKKHIFVGYIGGDGIVFDKYGRPSGSSPNVFLVFDLQGNYIKTIDVGLSFSFPCVDKDNQRLIVCFDSRENTFGYINLDSFLK